MNDVSWERLTDAIDVKLGIKRHGRDARPLADRPDLSERIEYIEFTNGGQEFRLERSTGPAIIDRKSHYSHRAGTANRMEYIYDEHETAQKVTLYRQEAGDWVAVDISQLEL
jgi:hypothetical protein